MQEISIHTKQSLIMMDQRKCNVVINFGQEFKNQFSTSFDLGLPLPWNLERWFFIIEIYNGCLEKERNNNEQFKDWKWSNQRHIDL